jgi:DNA-binding CsgD family transcriptional regulator
VLPSGMPRKGRRLREELTQALARTHTLEGCFSAADRLVRPALGATAVTWSTVDPATLLHTHCVILADLGHGQTVVPTNPAHERRIFELEWEERDPNTFAAMFRRCQRSAALRLHADPDRVSRFSELLAPQGCVDELRALCVLDGALWGTFTCYRFGEGVPPFDADDEALAESVSDVIARALRRCMLRAACAQPARPGRPAMLVVDARNAVNVRSGDADAMLTELGEQRRAIIASLAAAARSEGEASVQVTIDGGLLALHATLATEGDGAPTGDVAIIIERPRRPELAPLILQAFGLTAREREVAEELFAGASRKEIAERLSLEEATVGDHLKAIYKKAQVDGRSALLARVYSDFFAGPKSLGAHPAPWGHYLA